MYNKRLNIKRLEAGVEVTSDNNKALLLAHPFLYRDPDNVIKKITLRC